MNIDYAVKAAISYNLEDALEELAQISDMFRPNVEVDESELKVRMAHLYSHLNTAWNMRNVSEADLESADGEQMKEWSRFPTDLDPFP
jgi:hypothetical protein